MLYFSQSEHTYKYLKDDLKKLKINKYIICFDKLLKNTYIITYDNFQNYYVIYKNLEMYQLIKNNEDAILSFFKNQEIKKCIPIALTKNKMTEYICNFYQTQTKLKLLDI